MFTITSASNPSWADAANTIIDLTVTFAELADTVGSVPFSVSSTGTEDYEKTLYASAVAGDYGTIAAYAALAPTAESARAWRDTEITASQWIVERHRDQVAAGTTLTITADEYTELLTYRQALRDWPTVTDFPADSTKPTEPTWLAAAETAAEDATTATTDATTSTDDTTTTSDESSSADSTDADTDSTETDATTTTAS